MLRKNTEIKLYVDALIIQAAFGDETISKEAQSGLVSQLISSVKDYVGDHIDKEHPADSVINILAPGAFVSLVNSLFPSLKWLGIIVGLGMSMFHIDVSSILKGIVSDVKGLISGNKQTTSDRVDSIVESHFSSIPQATQEEAEEYIKTKSVKSQLREASLFKTALIDYSSQDLVKNGGAISNFIFGKAKTTSLLSKAVGWILKAILASAGLMVAGDAMNALVGRPSAFTGTLKDGKPVEPSSTPSNFSKQKVFTKIGPIANIQKNTSSNSWIENVEPTQSNIENLVLKWMTDVYPESNQFKNLAIDTAGFKTAVETIVDYNDTNQSKQMTFIPRAFDTEKKVVDLFIDEVAEKVPTKTT